MQQVAQSLRLDQAFDGVEQRVVALHQVGHEHAVVLSCDRDQGVGLLDRHRQRFLADHVLAGFERREGLRIVQKRRGGDVDQVDVGHGPRSLSTSSMSGMPNRRGGGRPPMRSRHPASRRHLGKLLKGKSPKPPQPITPAESRLDSSSTPFSTWAITV